MAPSSSTFKVFSPRMFLHEDTRVSELISPDLASWKTQVIDAVFLPYEADLIKSIPLSIQLLKDKLVCVANSNGLFSVCSAYRLVMDLSRPVNHGTSSDSSRNHKFWRLLWRLQVPHKVRHFSWRVCHGILPTKENLVRRGVLQDDRCDDCREGAENSGHFFWLCQRAMEVWQCTKLHFHFEQSQVKSFLDLLWMLLMSDNFNEDAAALVVTIAWSLWYNRKEVRHGESKKNGSTLVQ